MRGYGDQRGGSERDGGENLGIQDASGVVTVLDETDDRPKHKYIKKVVLNLIMGIPPGYYFAVKVLDV